MPRKESRLSLKKRGICTWCCVRRARVNRTKCAICASRNNNYRLDEHGKTLPEYREKSNIYLRKRREKLKELVDKYKLERGCLDCGYNKYDFVLDFDHLPQFTKKKVIGALRTSSYTWDNILKEINKCEVVCSNCHRIRTAKRAGRL